METQNEVFSGSPERQWVHIHEIAQAAAKEAGLQRDYLTDCAMDFVVSITCSPQRPEPLSEEALNTKAGQFARRVANGLKHRKWRLKSLDAVSARSLSATSPAIVQAQSSPLYRQARQCCRHHDYRQAADLLQTLANTPGLAPDAIAFCIAQRDLCMHDLGLPVSAAPTLVSAPARPPQDADCGPRALLLLCQRLGVKTDLQTLRKTAGTTGQGTTLAGLQQAAEKLGLKAEGVQVSREALSETATPAIAWTNRTHYIALLSLSGNGDKATATIFDPNKSAEETISQEQLLQRSGGYLLLIRR